VRHPGGGFQAGAILAVVRGHPRHLVLGAGVSGLLAAPVHPLAVVAALLVLLGLAGRGVLVPAVVLGLCAGALTADLRLEALSRTTLGPLLDRPISTRATLLEAPGTRTSGSRAALVRLAGPRGEGEVVLLRAPPWARWDSTDQPATAGVGSRSSALSPGRQIAVSGELLALPPREEHARRQGAHALLAAEAVRPTGGRRGGLAGMLDGVRERAEAAVSRGLPSELGALARGMVLGQDDALSEDLREAMRASGLAHLVAASGQNVLLLSALVLGLCALVGVPLRVRLALAIALVVLYVPLAGAGPSIQRAGVMGIAGLLAALAGRPASRWYAVLLAAALTLAVDPRSAADPGWQLSFAAVLAMLALSRPLRERLEARRLPGALAEALALTLAATIGTAPLLAAHFERLSLVSVPANLLAALPVGPVMWVGTLAAALGQFSPALAAPVAAVATWPLGFLAWVGRACAELPLAEVQVGLPGPAGVAVAYAAIAVLACSLRARRATLALALIAGAAVLPGPGGGPGPPRAVRISFLDVGQGDATLVQSPQGAAVLFDGGPPGTGLVDDLRAAGVERLDAVVATHQSLDHDGGLPAVVRELPVGLFLDGGDGTGDPRFRALQGMVAARRIRSVPAVAGQVLRAPGLTVRILSPPPRPAGPAPEDPNPRAVVAHVEGRGLDALLSGDAESPALLPLDLPEVDVLKVPHHGSADEGLPLLLKRLDPTVAAITVGRNTYGHPTAPTLAALGAAVPAVRRTDQHGTITVTASSRGPAVSTER